jgi:hypothetical protein
MTVSTTPTALAREAITLFFFLRDCAMGTAVHGEKAASVRYDRLAGLALKRYERRYRKAVAPAKQS